MKQEVTAAALWLSVAFMLIPASAAQAPTTEDFVKTVTISDTFEIKSGQLAAKKAQNDDAKSFGKHMADDHSKTSEDLKKLIADEDIKIEPPSKLDDEHQASLDKLNDLSGNQFDKEYARMQIDAHQKAISLFDSYSAAGENEKLKQWASDTLPTLKDHLKEAEKLNTSADKTASTEDDQKPDRTAQAEANQKPDAARTEESRSTGQAHNENPATDAEKSAPKSNIKYVKRQAPTDWTSEALVGRTVENANGDNLGEINNVIINEKGSVVAAVIGVGGFLGIGEKNVAVPFEALEFRTVDPTDSQKADTKEEKSEQKREAAEARFDAEHDDMHIVLNTTKEDLEGAPEFAWLDDQGTDRAQDDKP